MEADSSIRTIIVKGEGRAFSAGYDLTPSRGGADAVVRRHRSVDDKGRRLLMGIRTGMQQITDIHMYFWNMAKITIAQVHGYAVAGGCELAMMADLVVAADDAQLGHPGLRGLGTSRTGVIWPLVIGMRKAKELYYTGENVTGLEAEEIGMINYSWPLDELDKHTIALADRIAIMSADQIVGQASRNGWTVGVTMDDLVGAQCGAVVGLHPRDEEWLSGKGMHGVWYGTLEDSSAHQHAMDTVEYGRYKALVVSPLVSGRLNPPDICLIYATPAQMILFINGLQWLGYKKLEWGCVGESACADSWGRALATGEPSLSIPCFAERRYGGVMEDELLMALPPKYLPGVIEGLERLSGNGLRYPIPTYSVSNDVRAGMGVSYGDR